MMNFPGFDDVKMWFDFGWWDKSLVKLAVEQKKITADQYKTITSEDYSAVATPGK
ncbi:XkdX family protein [Schleiferilactobacillus shenzhenensis]|uniref:XkdX n=1 Tax=Schleiferilactobacillus shenzhenensis LY-73 TaxID=1231336 RepID=U4THX7_9LACO|nr:XkdX family protein [Schleiferilactobacillus shenzhenensis]ERL63774.1 hypothetical protein L248_2191 [Schleiferilactobacillus shenzhenensis LY-73]